MSEEEVEEKKRIEREAGRLLAHLEERVKDLELEASCAKAREDAANKLVEEYARVHAETRWVANNVPCLREQQNANNRQSSAGDW